MPILLKELAVHDGSAWTRRQATMFDRAPRNVQKLFLLDKTFDDNDAEPSPALLKTSHCEIKSDGCVSVLGKPSDFRGMTITTAVI